MRSRSLLIAFLASLLSASPSAHSMEPGAAACAQAVAGVRASLQNAFGGYHASVLVQRGEQQLVQASFGAGVTEHTRFLVGSVTKTLHATIATQFLNEGRLNLESTVAEELPKELASALPASWLAVRVRNLLHHTSGIPDYLNRDTPAEQQASDAFLKTLHDFLSILAFLPRTLEFQPDTELRYSNTNYLILGEILQTIAHEPDSVLFAQRLTNPLAMSDTGTIEQFDASILGGTEVFPANMVGVGNAYSSSQDLMKFLVALDGTSFLPQSWLEKMFTADPNCHGNSCERYGLGFSLRDPGIDGHRWVLHQGHLNTVSALVAKIPDLALNMTVVSDRASFNNETLALGALTELVQAGCASAIP